MPWSKKGGWSEKYAAMWLPELEKDIFPYMGSMQLIDITAPLCRQKSLEVQVHYRPSLNGLHMDADSTGIKFLGEGEWKTKKHGAERPRQWRKLLLGIDADTLQIRAIVVTTNEVGD